MAHSSDDRSTTSFTGVAFRYSNYDTPYWARANSREGRWHTAREAPTQYLSLTPDGAWAELIRAEDLRAEEDAALVHMPLWAGTIRQGMLVDYSSFEKAENAGFPPDALIDDAWGPCQKEGRRLRELGYAGVLAPSAALPGETNLTIFGARISATWGSPPDLASAIPATVVTVGAPPAGLVERVRFFGQAHPGYEEFRRIKAIESGERKPNTQG